MFNNILNTLTGNQQQTSSGQSHQTIGTQPGQQQTQQETGNNFLAGLVNVAQEVGRAIGDATQEGTQAVQSGATQVAQETKTTVDQAGGMSKEEMNRLAAGISDLVGKAAGTFSQNKGVVEEEMTAVDSKGGKVQISSISDGSSTSTAVSSNEQTGGGLLAGLMGVAKHVGQVIGEKAPAGGTTTAKVEATVITNVPGDFSTSTAEIDNVEGEIGKVTTGGYTADKEITSTEQTTGILTNIVDKTKELAGGTVSTVATGVNKVVETASKGKDVVVEGTVNTGVTMKDTAVSAVTKAQDLAGAAVESTKNAGNYVLDTAASGLQMTKDLALGAVATAAEGFIVTGDVVIQGTKTAGGAVYDTAAAGVEKTKEGAAAMTAQAKKEGQYLYDSAASAATAVADNTKAAGHYVIDTAAMGVEKTKEGATAVVDKCYDTGVATKEQIKKEGQYLIDSAASTAGAIKDTAAAGIAYVADTTTAAVDKTKELAESATEQAKREGQYLVDSASAGVEKTKDTAAAVVDKCYETGVAAKEQVKVEGQYLYDSAASAAEALKDNTAKAVEKTQELGSATVEQAKTEGQYVYNSAASGAQAVKETVAEIPIKTQELGSAAAEQAKIEGRYLYDSAASGVQTIKDTAAIIPEKTAELGSAATEQVKKEGQYLYDSAASGAQVVKEGVVSAGEKARDVTTTGVEMTKNVVSSAAETAQKGAELAADKTKEAGSYLYDSTAAGIEKTKEGAATITEQAKKEGQYLYDSAASSAQAVKEGTENAWEDTKAMTNAGIDTAKEGAENLKENVKEFGENVQKKASEGADKIKEGAQSYAEVVKEGVESAAEKTQELGIAAREKTTEGLDTSGTMSYAEAVKEGIPEETQVQTTTIIQTTTTTIPEGENRYADVLKEGESLTENVKETAANVAEKVSERADKAAGYVALGVGLVKPQGVTREDVREAVTRGYANTLPTTEKEEAMTFGTQKETTFSTDKKILISGTMKSPSGGHIEVLSDIIDNSGIPLNQKQTEEIPPSPGLLTNLLQTTKSEAAGRYHEFTDSATALAGAVKEGTGAAVEVLSIGGQMVSETVRGGVEEAIEQAKEIGGKVIETVSIGANDLKETAKAAAVQIEPIEQTWTLTGKEELPVKVEQPLPDPVKAPETGLYESALGVGTVLLEHAAALASVMKEATESLAHSEYDAANSVSEDLMYGPDRDASSSINTDVVDKDGNNIGIVNYGPSTTTEENTQLTENLVDSAVVGSNYIIAEQNVQKKKENDNGTRLKTVSESNDFEIIQPRAESQQSDSSWFDVETRDRSGSITSKMPMKTEPIKKKPLDKVESDTKEEEEEEIEVIPRTQSMSKAVRPQIRSRSGSTTVKPVIPTDIGGLTESNLITDIETERESPSGGDISYDKGSDDEDELLA